MSMDVETAAAAAVAVASAIAEEATLDVSAAEVPNDAGPSTLERLQDARLREERDLGIALPLLLRSKDAVESPPPLPPLPSLFDSHAWIRFLYGMPYRHTPLALRAMEMGFRVTFIDLEKAFATKSASEVEDTIEHHHGFFFTWVSWQGVDHVLDVISASIDDADARTTLDVLFASDTPSLGRADDEGDASGCADDARDLAHRDSTAGFSAAHAAEVKSGSLKPFVRWLSRRPRALYHLVAFQGNASRTINRSVARLIYGTHLETVLRDFAPALHAEMLARLGVVVDAPTAPTDPARAQPATAAREEADDCFDDDEDEDPVYAGDVRGIKRARTT